MWLQILCDLVMDWLTRSAGATIVTGGFVRTLFLVLQARWYMFKVDHQMNTASDFTTHTHAKHLATPVDTRLVLSRVSLGSYLKKRKAVYPVWRTNYIKMQDTKQRQQMKSVYDAAIALINPAQYTWATRLALIWIVQHLLTLSWYCLPRSILRRLRACFWDTC